MTPQERKVMEQALEALESINKMVDYEGNDFRLEVEITAIKEALSSPKGEAQPIIKSYLEKDNSKPSVWNQPEQNPQRSEDINLSCKSTQARLAASWGYVKAQPEQEPDWKGLVLSHNEDCESRCDMDRCGYKPYYEYNGRRCPDCPIHEKIWVEYTPPQRKPLTHEQRFDLLSKFEPHKNKWEAPSILIDMVEVAHGIKENT